MKKKDHQSKTADCGKPPETPVEPPPSAHHSATLLLRALEHRAVERRHSAKELARSLGIHVSHWYRVRKNAQLLAHCERAVLVRMAAYVRWPLGRVYLATGSFTEDELHPTVTSADTEHSALAQLQRSSFAARLSTPIAAATPDHRLLIAELYLALQSSALREARASD